MELLQEIFLYATETIEEALTGPADLSLIQSILFGTGAFIAFFCFYGVVYIIVKHSILQVGYKMLIMEEMEWEVEYKKTTSLTERIFLTRLRQEARQKRGSVWFYWLLHMLNCILLLVSITIWVSTIVTQRGAFAMLNLMMSIVWFIFLITVIHIHDMIFIPEEREAEMERYRWDKKKKK